MVKSGKQNIFTIAISDKAVAILNELGYIDKRQKNRRSKSLSGFFNELLIDWAEKNKNLNHKEIEYELEYGVLKKLQSDFQSIEKKIIGQAGIVKRLAHETGKVLE